jgi:hypothetical protein
MNTDYRIAATLNSLDMVCFISVNTQHDDDHDDTTTITTTTTRIIIFCKNIYFCKYISVLLNGYQCETTFTGMIFDAFAKL